MYLLTQTALGDSSNYEVLSFEEVEDLKRETTVLSSRIAGTKRKLELETKLRDAAQSLGRLYSPPSPRSSGEYGNTHRRSRNVFGRSGTSEALDKSDSELAVSQRRCEQLAQELWKLESRAQKTRQRLLEHTAGVLQMTHKGLKKGPNNSASNNAYDAHDFDDRSLYRTTEHLDSFGVHGRIEPSVALPVSNEAMQAMERRLEEISERMHDMMIQSNPGEFIDPPPQLSKDGGPVNPNGTAEAHLAYIQNGMDKIVLHMGTDRSAPLAASEVSPEAEGAWKVQLTEINNQVQTIVDRFGLTHSPTLPPPPNADHGEGLKEQLSYLQTGVNGLENRVDKVLEQKSILTTQIQQQRELNSKSDAERDAHIGELTEQLTSVRRDLEVSERESNASRDELTQVMEQLNAMRHSGSSQEESKAALVQAEGEVARLQSVVTSLHSEADARINEVSEARDAQDQAQEEVKRLQDHLDALQRDYDARVEEVSNARDRAEGEVKQLQAIVEAMQNDTNTKSEEAREAREHAENEVQRLNALIITMQHETASMSEVREARDQAEDEVKRLQSVIEDLQNETEAKGKEAREARDHAESESQRLQDVIVAMQRDTDSRSLEAKEALDRAEAEVKRQQVVIETLQINGRELQEAHDHAKNEIQRLQNLIETMENDSASSREIQEAHDHATSEIQRLQNIIETMQNDTDSRSEEINGARDRAEKEVAQLEAAIQQIRSQSDARIQEADSQRAQSDETATRLQNEMTELEGEIVRVTTELTMVKAELDGAYGTRAQRAAEVATDPGIQRENDALVTRNIELTEELAALKSQRGGGDLQQRADTLERELRETIDDYEAMTKASIEFEKERERFEGFIDSLRDRCEHLETQLAEERISWMNLSSPTSVGRDGASETTSTMVLKNEFKKMMRDTRNENMKILRVSFF
jgi:peptidoglycan hydrolase CwlO-like protein